MPLVTAAAMLLPLRRNFVSEQPAQPRSCSGRRENGAMSDMRDKPGATTSGFANASYHVGPRELNGATRSSARVSLSFVLVAPTVMTEGAFPGEVNPA
jgi:hypothetical protein